MTLNGKIKVIEISAIYNQNISEKHIVSHIWPINLPQDLHIWITFKGQIKVTELSNCYIS